MFNERPKSVVYSQLEDKSLQSKHSNYIVDNSNSLSLYGNKTKQEEAFSKMDILTNLKEKDEKVKKIILKNILI